MLSRVAERIYWMARYVERTENIARLINVNTLLLLDLPRGVSLGWDALINMTGANETFSEFFNEPNERNVVQFMLVDRRHPISLLSALASAREDARTIRDIIPREAWETINELYLRLKEALPASLARGKRYEALLSVIEATQQLNGILAGGMLHDQAYDFLLLGRNLERADMVSRIIDVRTADALPEALASLAPWRSLPWMNLLRSLSAYQAFRQYYHGMIHRRDVLEFLFKNAEFPRAVRCAVGEVCTAIGRLPNNQRPLALGQALSQRVDRARIGRFDDPAVHRFVDRVQKSLGDIHLAVAQTWFLHIPAAPRKRLRSDAGADPCAAVR